MWAREIGESQYSFEQIDLQWLQMESITYIEKANVNVTICMNSVLEFWRVKKEGDAVPFIMHTLWKM